MKTHFANHIVLAGLIASLAFDANASEEQDLITILRSGSTPIQKADACKKLRVLGTAESVPALAALLVEERTSQAARYALEGMPFQEAGAALRQAAGTTSGLIKAGLIDSLGWRRDTAAVPLLIASLSDADPTIASTAAAALGRIGGKDAVDALRSARDKAPSTVRPAVIEGLMRSAELLLAEGRRAEATAIYKSLFEPREEGTVRVAAYAGSIRSAGDRALGLVVSGLEGSDPCARLAALQLAGEIATPGATKAYADLMPKSPPVVQIALLDLLRTRNDVAALPAVLEAARSPDAGVRAAAMTALAALGDASAVRILAEAVASRDAAEQAAARQALVVLNRGDIAGTLVAHLAVAVPAVQLEIVRALSARGDKSAVPALLDLARGDRPSARKAALQALGKLADGSHLGALVQLMADAKDGAARDEVRGVFESLAEQAGKEWSLDAGPLVRGLASDDLETRKALLLASASFADEQLRGAFRSALKDSDQRIRSAAERALCASRDAAMLPDLIEVGRKTSEASVRTLAVEGIVRLATDEGSNLAGQQRIEALSAAFAIASNQGEKRVVLAGLPGVPHRATLSLAEKAFADSTVKPEAEIASFQIAEKLGSAEFVEVERSLARLAEGAVNPQVRTNAQALLKKLNSGWLYAGPYRQEGKQAQQLFDIQFAPEQAGTGQIEWRTAPGSTDLSRPGEVDLSGVVGGDHCVVYLKTRVYVPIEQPVLFSIGSDDGIKLWVNGELAHANNAVRGLTPGQDRAKGRLRQGWNDLFVKITQHTLGCGMVLRITPESGRDVPGLRLDPRGGIQQ